ncbi:hypothetical protein [Mycobacteroides chelonae]|uniref:hypothetical protein n=1 Tax=Mycobacteroides chelonae TaxID=1774 RepID=UPI0018B0B1C7|nr:hypothetical protein [Mycobacteroides chelonae]MBF9328481.1 hypothetical protein [Mycobacteroides chelonae]MBF9422659.1 hypothetical protein [Mycobacteroides chelonae]
MTVPLHGQKPPEPIVMMLAHLAPLGPCEMERNSDDPLPFRQVNLIDGTYDPNLFYCTAVLSIHTLGKTIAEAHREAIKTDQRIMLLGSEIVDIPMPDGTVANVDYLDFQQRSALREYKADNVFRLKAICELGLSFI